MKKATLFFVLILHCFPAHAQDEGELPLEPSISTSAPNGNENGSSNGRGRNNSNHEAPELDPSSFGSALLLILGSYLVLNEKQRNKI